MDVQDDMEITNLPELKKIIIKNNALPNLESLIIQNNNKLKTIVIEKGNDPAEESIACRYVDQIILESSFFK